MRSRVDAPFSRIARARVDFPPSPSPTARAPSGSGRVTLPFHPARVSPRPSCLHRRGLHAPHLRHFFAIPESVTCEIAGAFRLPAAWDLVTRLSGARDDVLYYVRSAGGFLFRLLLHFAPLLYGLRGARGKIHKCQSRRKLRGGNFTADEPFFRGCVMSGEDSVGPIFSPYAAHGVGSGSVALWGGLMWLHLLGLLRSGCGLCKFHVNIM